MARDVVALGDFLWPLTGRTTVRRHRARSSRPSPGLIPERLGHRRRLPRRDAASTACPAWAKTPRTRHLGCLRRHLQGGAVVFVGRVGASFVYGPAPPVDITTDCRALPSPRRASSGTKGT